MVTTDPECSSTPSPPRRHGQQAAAARMLATVPVFAVAVLVVGLIASASAFAAPPVKPTAKSASAADALARERQKIDEVVAAALVAALGDELGGRQIEIRLAPLSVQTSSLRDRLVSGRGQLQIDAGSDWIGFSFDVLYDAVMESAGYPELRIGGMGEGGRVLPNDARLIRELDDRVVELVGREFGYQQVRMQLDQITTVEAGKRFLRIDAHGLVDFGRDGSAPARVEALYDREGDAWLRVAYALEPTPGAPLPAPPPVAPTLQTPAPSGAAVSTASPERQH